MKNLDLVFKSQFHLFVFLAAVAAGTLIGGPLGDRFGRKYIIWVSILGASFTLLLPYANLFWTGILSVYRNCASAFSAILVFAQELMPGKVGMISGLFLVSLLEVWVLLFWGIWLIKPV
jgi:FSR family fosmidomycin resistance protein-like MFS transporter